MELKEYQEKAHSTSLETMIDGKVENYPFLGLVDEVGEVAGKVKKLYRDKDANVTEEVRLSIKKELGDVCWYIAECSTVCGIKMEDFDMSVKVCEDTVEIPICTCVFKLSTLVSTAAWMKDMGENEVDGFNIGGLLYESLAYVKYIGGIFGIEFDDILEGNIEKLFKRKEEGKIQGDGDDR